MTGEYLPVLLQLLIAAGFAGVALILSVLLGQSQRRNATKDSAYECGMVPIGQGGARFSVKFYLVAMLFVLFDLEVVFLYPWAVTFRDWMQTDHAGAVFGGGLGFVGILAVAFAYVWKKGALDWRGE